MAFDVRFFALAKRPNSTSQPNLTGGTLYSDIQLKGPCSIRQPAITLRMAAGADPVGFNFCYIAAFKRYYFVNDWENDGYNWTAYLKEDELATFKTAIGNSTQYILRSSHSYDGDIIDTLYPAKGDTRIDHSWGSTTLGSVTGGWYILGIQNRDTHNWPMGSSRYYAMDSTGMHTLMGKLFSTATFANFGSGSDNLDFMTEDIFKSLFNPIEYITSCMFIPFQPPVESGMLTSLSYGYWLLPDMVNLYRLDMSQTPTKSGYFTIPRHPFASSRGNYCNTSPLTRYTMTFQPFGQITLDPSLIYTTDDDKLYYNVYVDPISGVGTLELSIIQNNATKIVHAQCGQIGVPVSVAQMSRDYMGFMTSTLGAAGGAASSMAMGNVPGVFGSVASGIADATQSMIPQIQTQGANGSFAAYYATQPFLEAIFLEPVASDNADLGRPLCQKGTISSYPGYLLILNPDISINEATREEMDAIREYMETGFFYE